MMRELLKYSLLLLLISCSERNDVVFSANDDLHRLTLYQQNNDFEMLHDGFNTVEGNYQFKNDTIYLTYAADEFLGTDQERHANDVLARTIVVDKEKKRIYSPTSGKQFCGQIWINELK